MTHRILPLVSGSVVALALSFASPAHAALDACGGIYLNSDASCAYVPTQECTTNCAPPTVEQSCIATTSTDCESSCTATATTECTRDCETTCMQDCTTTPASSQGLCHSECEGDCDVTCDAGDDFCHASCSHNCDTTCEHHCHSDDQDVACSTKCGTTCDGRCTATATVDCQRNCETTELDSCQTTTVQQCQTDCHDQGGAIFCDGQFINASDVDACAGQIEASINVHIDLNVDVSGDANAVVKSTSNDTSAKCSIARAGTFGSNAGGAFFTASLGALGALLVFRRRRS